MLGIKLGLGIGSMSSNANLGNLIDDSIVASKYGASGDSSNSYINNVLTITALVTSSAWMGAYLQTFPSRPLTVSFVADLTNASSTWLLESTPIVAGYNQLQLSSFEAVGKLLFSCRSGYNAGDYITISNIVVK